ncbi:MAG: uL22 family ribosomal protein [Nanoarchaeota archaeon]|nr:uL22 family ribosomal protein [Nanoarchaeota archaeon]
MTEKNYNPEQKMEKAMKKQEIIHDVQKHETVKKENEISETEKDEAKEEKKEVQKQKEKERPKRTMAVVNGFDVPISTKHSAAICRFIKRKKIQEAIKDLELVAKVKKPVPMKGEIPHRKGNIMSGRFPQKAAGEFIILLKSLSANSAYHGLENPVIVEAVANIGARPFGRHGIRRKRTHIRIVAEEVKPAGEKL